MRKSLTSLTVLTGRVFSTPSNLPQVRPVRELDQGQNSEVARCHPCNGWDVLMP